MIWLIGFVGVGVWIAYLACGLLIAKVFATGTGGHRAFYWVLPIVVGILGAGVLSLMARYSKAAFGIRGWLSAMAGMALFAYLYQWIMQIYVFKCSACGTTHITYRVAWRRGIYTCPSCKRQYFKGVMGST
jgi:hypothetical protein